MKRYTLLFLALLNSYADVRTDYFDLDKFFILNQNMLIQNTNNLTLQTASFDIIKNGFYPNKGYNVSFYLKTFEVIENNKNVAYVVAGDYADSMAAHVNGSDASLFKFELIKNKWELINQYIDANYLGYGFGQFKDDDIHLIKIGNNKYAILLRAGYTGMNTSNQILSLYIINDMAVIKILKYNRTLYYLLAGEEISSDCKVSTKDNQTKFYDIHIECDGEFRNIDNDTTEKYKIFEVLKFDFNEYQYRVKSQRVEPKKLESSVLKGFDTKW